jgi:hypothetical protein
LFLRYHKFNFAILISFQQNLGFLVAFQLKFLVNKKNTNLCNDFHIHIVVWILYSIKKQGNDFFNGFSTLYIDVQILVIWNSHEYGILMNCKGMCVYNQCMNCECVHIVMQIYYHDKCEIGLPRFNPHIPFNLATKFNLLFKSLSLAIRFKH